ncbi:MAG: peptide chain release factor 2 [Calditrichaeota bacterium]|nr:peptide chain release factor 2 [Calditrichota bacterium]
MKEQAADPVLWSDPDRARDIGRRISRLEEPVVGYDRLSRDVEDLAELAALLESAPGEERLELEREAERIERVFGEWEFRLMLGGVDDRRGAILTVHAGAGGTESADWAAMLLRLYLRYCERRKWKSEVIDLQPGEQAGIKSAAVEITGDYGFGYLKAESGVHRLVRISPFDSNARRHTSFASVFVYPEVDEGDPDIAVNPADLRIDTFRASGAGGQHINKTDSAVRITHLPTGIVATCQAERSQHRNRDMAMKYLLARLLQKQRDEELKKRDAMEAQKREIAWGSQIRSYVLHPYRMVKDLRTDVETSDTDGVLDGDIDRFIEAYLLSTAKG